MCGGMSICLKLYLEMESLFGSLTIKGSCNCLLPHVPVGQVLCLDAGVITNLVHKEIMNLGGEPHLQRCPRAWGDVGQLSDVCDAAWWPIPSSALVDGFNRGLIQTFE